MELNYLNSRDLPGSNKRSQKLVLKIDTLPEKIRLKYTMVKQYERRFKEEKDIDGMTNTTSGECPYDVKSEYSGSKSKVMDKNRKLFTIRCDQGQDFCTENLFQLYIRAGMEVEIRNTLKKEGPRILDTKYTIDMNLQKITNSRDNEYSCSLQLSAFHLAILAQQEKSVQCILDYIIIHMNEERNKIECLIALFKQKILLEAINDSQISKYDQSLNGMNIFHLSCQFYPETLRIFQKALFDELYLFSGSGSDKIVKERELLVKAKTSSFGNTPLHIAAKNSLTHSARLLIQWGADIDAVDNDNEHTPLRKAVQHGNEKIVSLLCNEGANVNKICKSEKTPLHVATNSKIARLLLDFAANGTETKKNAWNDLLLHNENMARVVMDDFIETNEEGHESKKKLVVYNLEFFKPNKNSENEMSRHEKMMNIKSDLLYHPLSEAMTNLKEGMKSSSTILSVLLHILFTCCLTFYITNPMEEYVKNQTFEQSMNELSSGPHHRISRKRDIFAYSVSWVSTLILLLSEIAQFIKSPLEHIRRAKNYFDIFMISITIACLSIDLHNQLHDQTSEQIDIQSVRLLASLSIFLAWVNIVLLISSIEKLGIYVHMFINVSKTLLFFMAIYLPALIAFALFFHVLMPSKTTSFSSSWKSMLKIFSMFIGELEFETNFINNEDLAAVGKTYELDVECIVQLMSVCFLCFGTIVIMNLLVGLTVNEIDELKTKASRIILKEKTFKLIRDEMTLFEAVKAKFRMKEEPERFTWNPVDQEMNVDEKTLEKTTLFKELEEKRNILCNKEESIAGDMKVCVLLANLKDQPEVERKHIFDWIYFFWQKINRFLPDLLEYRSYPVYFYHENKTPKFWDNHPNSDDFTGFRFPKELVDNTLKCLKAKEEIKEELDAQCDEQEEIKNLLSRHKEEILNFFR